MDAWWSYALAPFGLLGLWMSGSRNRWGWALSIGTQVLWLTYAVQTRQWGFIPGSAAYGAIYLRNFMKCKPELSEPHAAFAGIPEHEHDHTPCKTCHSY